MSLLTINAEFSLIGSYLKRIAEAMERANPVPSLTSEPRRHYQRGPETVGTYGLDKKWAEEQLTDLLQQLAYSDSEIEHFKSHLDELPEDLKHALASDLSL